MLGFNPEGIPEPLRSMRNGWFPADHLKRPCKLSGSLASYTRQAGYSLNEMLSIATWATGYGIRVPAGWTILDWDGIIQDDGNPTPWVASALQRLNSRTQYSLSGKGLRTYIHGEFGENRKIYLPGGGHVEIYGRADSEYVILTGQDFGPELPVRDCVSVLEELIDELETDKPKPTKVVSICTATLPAIPAASASRVSDVIDQMPASIRSLYDGHTGKHPSRSEAGMALMRWVSLIDPDPAVMQAIYVQSNLYDRSKPHVPEYTVYKVLSTPAWSCAQQSHSQTIPAIVDASQAIDEITQRNRTAYRIWTDGETAIRENEKAKYSRQQRCMYHLASVAFHCKMNSAMALSIAVAWADEHGYTYDLCAVWRTVLSAEVKAKAKMAKKTIQKAAEAPRKRLPRGLVLLAYDLLQRNPEAITRDLAAITGQASNRCSQALKAAKAWEAGLEIPSELLAATKTEFQPVPVVKPARVTILDRVRDLLNDGKTIDQIARQLKKSTNYVRVYVKRLTDKGFQVIPPAKVKFIKKKESHSTPEAIKVYEIVQQHRPELTTRMITLIYHQLKRLQAKLWPEWDDLYTRLAWSLRERTYQKQRLYKGQALLERIINQVSELRSRFDATYRDAMQKARAFELEDGRLVNRKVSTVLKRWDARGDLQQFDMNRYRYEQFLRNRGRRRKAA